MLWVKIGEYTYLAEGFNTFDNKLTGFHEMWITRSKGKGTLVFEGTKEQVQEMYSMFLFSCKKRVPLIEVK